MARPGQAWHGEASQATSRQVSQNVAQRSKQGVIIMAKSANVEIIRNQVSSFAITIVGESPYIQNNFSQKAMEQMLAKHVGKTIERGVKVPSQVLADAQILNMDGKVCIPPTAIKKAMLTASTLFKGLKKTHLRQGIFIAAQSIPIEFKAMIPRLDMVRTSGMNRTPDVRFRPQFNDWKATFVIRYGDVVSSDVVLNLLEGAGRVGIGEWRPEKDGTFGCFRVDAASLMSEDDLIAVVLADCASPIRPLTIPTWAMDCELTPEIMRRIAGGGGVREEDDGEEDVAAAE